jgi:hypothetical protein
VHPSGPGKKKKFETPRPSLPSYPLASGDRSADPAIVARRVGGILEEIDGNGE